MTNKSRLMIVCPVCNELYWISSDFEPMFVQHEAFRCSSCKQKTEIPDELIEDIVANMIDPEKGDNRP